MNKEQFLRLYSKISIFIGFLLLIFVYFFISSFPLSSSYPYGFHSLIETNVFTITFLNFTTDLSIVNTPLIVFITLLILNIYMFIRVGNTNEVEKKELQSVVFNNIIITLMLIIGQVAFVLMIPDSINGLVLNKVLFLTFHTGISDPVQIVFTSYLLTVLYIGYNIFVVLKTKEEKIVEEEEEYPSEMIDQIE